MKSVRKVVLAAVTSATWFSVAHLAGGEQPPTVKVMPKNAQFLTNMTAKEIRAKMDLVAESLGVQCEFCHVKGDHASDRKEHKLVARKMMRMTEAINQEYFADEVKGAAGNKADQILETGAVTCFTCHNGEEEPRTAPLRKALGAGR